MPNWCYTRIEFRGEPQKVKALYDFIDNDKANNAVGIKNDFKSKWLGNYLVRAGFSYNDYNCRGAVTYIGGIEEGGTFFTIDTETAWGPMLAMWKAIIEKVAPGVEIIYSAEEPGNVVLMTNDPYYVGKYYVELYDEEALPPNVAEALSWDAYDEVTETELRDALLSVLGLDSSTSTDNLIEALEELTGDDGVAIHKWNFVPVEDT